MRTEFQIAGITFRLKDNPEMASLRPEGACTLVAEPDNQYDPNAIKVMLGDVFIGYIPGPKSKFPEVQAQVLALIESGANYTVGIESYCYKEGKEWNNDHRGALGAITLYLECEEKQVSKPAKKETEHTPDGAEARESFNEGVTVLFRPIPHTYEYEGKPLKSVTRLVSEMYDPFDKEMIAARCAPSWGMKASDIVDMWSINGTASASLGTAIHAALENYAKFGERGLSKMGFLRDVVLSLPWNKGAEVGSEVLVTSLSRSLCGLCDMLTMTDEGLMVSDFKINVGAQEKKTSLRNLLYPQMPTTKLTKYIAQESLYAEMIEESGYKVCPYVCSYVWDGSWTTYKESRIMGILDKATGRF